MNEVAENIAQLLAQFEKDTANKEALDELRALIISQKNEPKIQKLKWLGKAEQFGYMFSELAKQGFIEMPGSRGEGSYSKYAKVCFELFDFAIPTTVDNLERAMNPEKNRLSESNRAKIIIPDIKDIS